MNRPHSHRNLLWSGHWPVVFHKQTGTLLYSLFVSWSFYWQSNGRVDGFTMCTLSDAYRRSMFAISFDMSISDLEKHYGKPYNRAYFEIKEVLKKNSFDWIQGSTYLTQSEDLGNLFRAIEALKKIEWFRKSVRDIRGYKVENWSNFTDIVKDV